MRRAKANIKTSNEDLNGGWRKWFQHEETEVTSTTQPPENNVNLQQQTNAHPDYQYVPEQQMIFPNFQFHHPMEIHQHYQPTMNLMWQPHNFPYQSQPVQHYNAVPPNVVPTHFITPPTPLNISCPQQNVVTTTEIEANESQVQSSSPSTQEDLETSSLRETISTLQESVNSLNKTMAMLHTEKLERDLQIQQLSKSLKSERENVSKLTDTVERLLQQNTTTAIEQAYNKVMYTLDLKKATGLRNISEESDSSNNNSLSRITKDSLDPGPPTVAELNLSSSTENFVSHLEFSQNVPTQVVKIGVVPGNNIEEVPGEVGLEKVTVRDHNIQTTANINTIIPQDLITNIVAPSFSASHINRVINWSHDAPSEATATNIETPVRAQHDNFKTQVHSTPQVPGLQQNLDLDAADLSRIVDDDVPPDDTQDQRGGRRNLRPNPKPTNFYQAGS
ncbi:unnamed protein product [Rotaria socialis]|nr:unnamed protein product [Rotaria socialis]